jgi:hypothetical protein
MCIGLYYFLASFSKHGFSRPCSCLSFLLYFSASILWNWNWNLQESGQEAFKPVFVKDKDPEIQKFLDKCIDQRFIGRCLILSHTCIRVGCPLVLAGISFNSSIICRARDTGTTSPEVSFSHILNKSIIHNCSWSTMVYPFQHTVGAVLLVGSENNWSLKLKGPKHEIFKSRFFTEIRPVLVGDLGTGEKMLFRKLILYLKVFATNILSSAWSACA